MKAAAAVLLLLATASLSAATRHIQSIDLDAELLASPHRQLLAQQGMQSAKALLGLDRNNKQLRVLAHGDSITEGWINTAWIKMPWTPKLQQQLQQKLGGDWRVEVTNGGEPCRRKTSNVAIMWCIMTSSVGLAGNLSKDLPVRTTGS